MNLHNFEDDTELEYITLYTILFYIFCLHTYLTIAKIMINEKYGIWKYLSYYAWTVIVKNYPFSRATY